MAERAFDRRRFLTSSAGVAAGAAVSLIGTRALGANEKIVCAFLGLGGRGRQLVGHVLSRDDTEVAYVVDLDPSRHGSGVGAVEKARGKKPKVVTDYHKALDDKDVDVLFNATPDHWHCLPVIHACQAGKDAYVEKPLSHNIWEGRQTVKAARKYKRIVQVGTQNRSAPYNMAAKKLITDGGLGKVHLVRVFNMKTRGAVPARPDGEPPKGVNYDLWLGPAPKRPFNPNHFHYRWHWFWDYSGGDIINDGVHQIDLARWLAGVGMPKSVVTTAGKFALNDAQDTPDTQNVHWEYDGLTMTFELTLWTPYVKKIPGRIRARDEFPVWPFCSTRIEIYGEKAMMQMGRHGGGWQVFDASWKPIAQHFGRRPSDAHIANLFDCVRSRKLSNADVEKVHLSTCLCHLGNISGRVGGDRLRYDAAAEQFIGHPEANKLVKRPGRKPYQIPDPV